MDQTSPYFHHASPAMDRRKLPQGRLARTRRTANRPQRLDNGANGAGVAVRRRIRATLAFGRLICYAPVMTTVEEIEEAVAALPPDKLARFRTWFEEFEAARFDRQIERDARSGKLDALAAPAVEEHRKGRTRAL